MTPQPAPSTPAWPIDIDPQIVSLRGQRVMLDAALARLYGVETRVLVQAVKRNAERFPADFMCQLTPAEFRALRSQPVISNGSMAPPPTLPPGRGGRRTPPYAFTEQGVAMLSSVLGSGRAIAVNIEIMRSFVRVRALAASHAELSRRLDEIERVTRALAIEHDTLSQETRAQLQHIFDVMQALTAPPAPTEPPEPPKREIGFLAPADTHAAAESRKRGPRPR